jgi:hypothetical protein
VAGALEDPQLVWFSRTRGGAGALALLHFGATPAAFDLPLPPGAWELALDSAAPLWRGPGTTLPPRLYGGEGLAMPPHSAALYCQPP